MRRRITEPARILIAALAAAALLPGAQPARAEAAAAATPNTALNTMFNGYGDAAGCADWSGADATQSVRLPSGKRAWFFADTYLNAVSERPLGFYRSFLNNSIIIQNGTSLRTVTGGNTCRETDTSIPFAERYAKTPFAESGAGFYWPGDGILVGSNVVKFFYRNVRQGSSWTDTNAAVASIPVSALESANPISIQPTLIPPRHTYGSHPINWGVGLLQVGSTVYIYGAGVVDQFNNRKLYLASAAPADLTNPGRWLFNTGHGQNTWSAAGDQAAAGPVSDDLYVENGFSVASVNGSYWLIQHEPDLNGGDIVAHPATTPYGFGSGKVRLYTPPEGPRDAAHKRQFFYEARLHPGLGAAGTVVVSYNVNSSDVSIGCHTRVDHDGSIYRPRFLNVPVQMFQAGAATSGVPTTATPGPSAYRPGIRTATGLPGPAGPARPADVPAPTGRAAAAAAAAPDNTWYDAWAPAQQANGGCPPLTRSTTLTATVTPGGTVNLSWDDYGRDMWYWIYSRDVTAGENFVRRDLWSTTPSAQDAPLLKPGRNGHTFEWYVVPFASGGGSQEAPRSTIVRLTISV
ncbi:hypothetical protein DMB66_20755 [Actinoplanes sp. ATCC 53533]|uniref:hypothetical protein n=1 Tax=Actinoplanes sp. ATCC 53533 TaxID=1288362 RepID=UPI000F77D590|nr:hypothetical protein [Actinoplanes sp. ATCC 53533]RSM64331.1 hypothetical protein DMB66_20755 [Actinoplanes sp. ATCC 53533]